MTGMAYVAVVGSGTATGDLYEKARVVGRLIVQREGIVVCGGLSGVMEAAARGAKEAGGTAVGILPDVDRRRENEYLAYSVATGVGQARNLAVVCSGDVVIAVGGEYGTLSEIGLARKVGRPVVVLEGWDLGEHVTVAPSPLAAVEAAFELIGRLGGRTMENSRVALVSGGNRGIGLEVCRQLPERGITVVLGSRDGEQGRAAAAGLSGGVIVRQLDVADPESVERLSRSIEEEFGRLDILVNNAAISNDEGQRGADADLDRVKESLEANLFGAWRLCRMAIPLMRRNGYGRIVNVSTGLAALEDMGGGSPGYRVSKTALNALTRILASELRGSGILVNAVNPGWVQTDMGGSGATRSVEEGAEALVWAATLPNSGPTGGFFQDRRPVPW